MTNYSRTTLRELKKRYLNILKKCLLANLLAFSFMLPAGAEIKDPQASTDVNGNPISADQVLLNALKDKNERVWINNTGLKYNVNLNGEILTAPKYEGNGGLLYNRGKTSFLGYGIISDNEIETSTATASGAAIYQYDNTLSFQDIDFIRNKATSTKGNVYGGTIYSNKVLTFNGHVNFEKNEASSKGLLQGGILYNVHTASFNTTTFKNNLITANDSTIRGGLLFNTNQNAIMEFNNHTIFDGNNIKGYEVNGGLLFNDKGVFTFSSADFLNNSVNSLVSNANGGLIYNSRTITFTDKVNIGGYLKDQNGNFMLDDENKKISLGNVVKINEAGSTAVLILNDGVIQFKDVDIVSNTVQSKGGSTGLIGNKNQMTIKHLKLIDNILISTDSYAQGAGLYNSAGTMTIQSGELVNNKVYSYTNATNYWAGAGAFYADGGEIKVNGEIQLKNNMVYGTGAGARGGAVSTGKTGIATFNEYAQFIHNKAVATNGIGKGGALYNEGQVQLNSDFLFASNDAKNGKDIYYESRNNTGAINIAGNIGTVGTIEGGIAGAPRTDTEFIPQINKSGTGLLVLGDQSENHEYEGAFTQTAGTTIANSERFFSHEKAVNTINGGELKTHGSEIVYKAVVGQNIDDTGAVLSAGKVMHYTTKPEMEVNAETLANITFAGEDMGATIGVGTYNKAEQEKEIALVGDRLVEYVDDKGTEETSDDEVVSYQATDKLFTIDTLASGERTMFKVTGALPNEKGNKIAFANGIVEIGDIQTLADYEFNSSTLKTPRDFEFKGKVTVNNLELSDGLGNLKMKELKVVKDSDLDIKNTKITTDLFTLDGENNVKVSVHSLSDYGQILAKETVSKGAGTLTMNLVGAPQDGVYKVFEQDTDLKLVTTHEFLDITDLENGSYKIARKKADELADKFGLNEEETATVSAVIGGNSENEAFQKVQEEIMETLKSGNKVKAKKALSAVGAKEHPVEQSVASEHLVALQNVVQAELHGAGVGRAGGEEEPRAKVYIKGLYDRTKSSMGEGFRARSKGAVLGVQSEVTEDLTLGVGYATSQTTAKEDLRRTEVDTNTGFISAHYQPNAWWVSGLATFSRGEYEEEKQILSSMGKASYDVDSWGAQVMTGYDIKLENAIITPEVGMRYLSVKQEGYTDTLGTTVSGTQSDYLTALVGVKGTWDMGAIRPTAGVTIGYDIISDDVSALNTLANGASYTVNGEALDRLSTTVTTGVEADLGERTTLKLEYSGTYRKEYQEHSGMLKLEVKF